MSGRRYLKCAACWEYDLSEQDGSKGPADVMEFLMERAGNAFDHVMDQLDDLDGVLRAELDHVEAMQKCRAFDPVAKDVEQIRSSLARMNSIRVWIGNDVRTAHNAAKGDGPDEEA